MSNIAISHFGAIVTACIARLMKHTVMIITFPLNYNQHTFEEALSSSGRWSLSLSLCLSFSLFFSRELAKVLLLLSKHELMRVGRLSVRGLCFDSYKTRFKCGGGGGGGSFCSVKKKKKKKKKRFLRGGRQMALLRTTIYGVKLTRGENKQRLFKLLLSFTRGGRG